MALRVVCSFTTGFDRVARTCAGVSGIELIEAPSEQDTVDALGAAAGLITFAGRYTAAVAAAVERSNISWIHLVTAGIDPLLRFPPPAGVRLSSGGRVWSKPVAEHAVAMLLALKHGLHLAERARVERAWSRQQLMGVMGVVRDLEVLLVGFGSIGRRIAQLLAPFEARLSAVARTRREQAGVSVHKRSRLPSLIPRADVIMVAVPFSPETEGLLGQEELSTTKPGAVLVDVSRGGVVNPQALQAALASGALGGAALDVFDTEPLPQSHPLWDLPNVILTPHVAGFGDTRALDEMAAICRANMQDFAAGRELRDGLTLQPTTAATPGA